MTEMTTEAPPASPSEEPSHWLGAAAVRRMRLPGPPLGRPLPSRIGSLASGVSRFAASTSRPVEVRRALAGPDPSASLTGYVRPPRWWVPMPASPEVAAAPAEAPARAVGLRRSVAAATSAPRWLAPSRSVPVEQLGGRELPRAARSVPNEQSWSPGSIVGGLQAEVANVRRHTETVAAGPMLMAADQARLHAATAARKAAEAAAAPSTPAPAVRRTPASAPPAASTPPAASAPPTAPVAPTARVAPRTPGDSGARTSGPGSSRPSAGDAGAEGERGGPSGPAPSSAAAPSTAVSASSAVPSPSAEVRRSAWQLSPSRPRFSSVVRRTPVAGRGPQAVEQLATASTSSGDRHLASAVSSPVAIRPGGSDLITRSHTAAPSSRRDLWGATSVVMRQAAIRREAAAAAPASIAAPTAARPTAAIAAVEQSGPVARRTTAAIAAVGQPAADISRPTAAIAAVERGGETAAPSGSASAAVNPSPSSTSPSATAASAPAASAATASAPAAPATGSHEPATSARVASAPSASTVSGAPTIHRLPADPSAPVPSSEAARSTGAGTESAAAAPGAPGDAAGPAASAPPAAAVTPAPQQTAREMLAAPLGGAPGNLFRTTARSIRRMWSPEVVDTAIRPATQVGRSTVAPGIAAAAATSSAGSAPVVPASSGSGRTAASAQPASGSRTTTGSAAPAAATPTEIRRTPAAPSPAASAPATSTSTTPTSAAPSPTGSTPTGSTPTGSTPTGSTRAIPTPGVSTSAPPTPTPAASVPTAGTPGASTPASPGTAPVSPATQPSAAAATTGFPGASAPESIRRVADLGAAPSPAPIHHPGEPRPVASLLSGAIAHAAPTTGGAIAMPELMTVRRRAAFGVDGTRSLASGFAGAEAIRPVTGATTAGSVGRPLVTPTPRAHPAPAASPSATSTYRSAATAGTAPAGSAAPSASTPAGPALRRTPASPPGASAPAGSSAPAPVATTAADVFRSTQTALEAPPRLIDRSINAPTTPGSPAGPTAPTSSPAGYPTPAPPREIATPATSPSTVLRWAHTVPGTPAPAGAISGHAAPAFGIARAAAAAPPVPGGVPVPGLLARAERGGEPLRRTPAAPAGTPTALPSASPPATPVPSTAGPWTTATPPTAPTGPPVPAVGRLTPGGAGPASSPTAASPAGDSGRISRMTVAPPRISITPARGDGAGAPAVPAVATSSAPTGATPASAQPGAPRSLVESTAHLFSSVPEGVVRRLLDEGGTPMSGHQHDSWSSEGPAPSTPGTVVRRWATPSGGSSATTLTGPGQSETVEALQPGGALDALVDAVVERVEQRVIDELERRGRRQDWAAF